MYYPRGEDLKGKVLYVIIEILAVLILVSELFEFAIYAFSNSSSFFNSMRESSYITIHKFISIASLPIFASFVAFGIGEIEPNDRKILVMSIMFYVVVRTLLVEFVRPYDYQNVKVDNYFSIGYFINFALIVLSFAVIFAALYYVVDYKLSLPRHWLMFITMMLFDQLMLFAYQLVLLYLFHRNIIIDNYLYIAVMLFPTCALQTVSVVAGIVIKEDRAKLIKAFDN